ncbi:ATP-binding protein [Streptomyces sp. NPDC012389]|uniref:ATP-binding protein n=1 Tax=unclassified Streptomyces TaxID=2593676 RepID=UPI00136FDD09|nr:ATP-binding protein [Streptomyces sp. SID8374]MYX13525.1 ATP-binding protein [Streptomyces sp. SID8374]
MGGNAVELPSDVGHIDEADAWADTIARSCGLGEDDRYRICLAVREAAANAVLHGNQEHPDKRVRLDWETQENRVRITVGDEGTGFTPPPPTGELNLTPSGRGLVLIDHLTDSYTVAHRDDPPGTDVVLVFRTTT